MRKERRIEGGGRGGRGGRRGEGREERCSSNTPAGSTPALQSSLSLYATASSPSLRIQ